MVAKGFFLDCVGVGLGSFASGEKIEEMFSKYLFKSNLRQVIHALEYYSHVIFVYSPSIGRRCLWASWLCWVAFRLSTVPSGFVQRPLGTPWSPEGVPVTPLGCHGSPLDIIVFSDEGHLMYIHF